MLVVCLTSPALTRPVYQTSSSVQDDIYGAEIYGEAVPQYERPAPSAVEEPELPAYEPLYSVKQVRQRLVLWMGSASALQARVWPVDMQEVAECYCPRVPGEYCQRQ